MVNFTHALHLVRSEQIDILMSLAPVREMDERVKKTERECEMERKRERRKGKIRGNI